MEEIWSCNAKLAGTPVMYCDIWVNYTSIKESGINSALVEVRNSG
jgi:hypothetical protein